MDNTSVTPTEAPASTPPPKSYQVDWQAQIDKCIKKRDDLKKKWTENTNYRKGKPLVVEPDEDAVCIPVDWARTKNKAAQLFFQVPNVILEAQQDGLELVAPIAGAALNDVLSREVKAHICMDEVLQDMINSAGIGVILVGIDVVKDTVQMPKYSPDQMAQFQDPTSDPMAMAQLQQEFEANGGQMPTIPQDVPVYQCYYGTRLSPGQLLWPVQHAASDWQKAPWLGYDEQVEAAVAIRKGWIAEDDLRDQDGEILTTTSEATEDDKNKAEGKFVTVQHIYYKQSLYKVEVKDPRKLGHLMFIKGKKDPVVDEDFKWQQYNPQTRDWVGMTTFPIKVGTLTTLSDEAIPPSDSEVGRPQVRELMRSRSQMIKQRDRSMPLRWFDVNQVDDDIAEQMRKGVYQDMIPMNGPGGTAIGEVARANYPREAWEFQSVIDRDLDEAWSMGRNQQGLDTPGETSATESNIVAQNSNVRIEYERVRVLRLFLEMAEGIFDLMTMFQDDQAWVKLVGPTGAQTLAKWDKNTLRGEYAFNAHPDSAVRVDVAQRRVESLNFYKMVRQDPLINPQTLLADIIKTHGYDPTKMMAQPQPPSPPPDPTRFSFVGADLANPMVVALIQAHSPKPLTPEDLAAAKKLMAQAGIPEMPPTMLTLPQAGQDGQPNNTLSNGPGGALEHPGPAPEVNPLNQRYEQGAGGATRIENEAGPREGPGA